MIPSPLRRVSSRAGRSDFRFELKKAYRKRPSLARGLFVFAVVAVSLAAPLREASAETDAERDQLARALRAMGLPEAISYELAPPPLPVHLARQYDVEEISAK